jgi:predicted helicase
MTDTIPCLDLLEKTACYPLFIYLQESGEESTLFDSPDPEERSFNVNEKIISFCEKKYGKSLGSPEDIFYFVYGALHDEDYRSKFQNDLKKGRTRISFPEGTKEFTCYVAAGRELGELHVNYESVDPWDDLEIEYSDAWNPENPESYRVQKMRYKKNGKIVDKTTVIYNSMITISGIPETAHDYRLGSRSAIDWIIDRYQIRTHKESGIVNDPNDWADEHDDPTYIFDLLRRIVTVSMRTNEIVAGLPKLDFEDAGLQK